MLGIGIFNTTLKKGHQFQLPAHEIVLIEDQFLVPYDLNFFNKKDMAV